MKKIIKNIATSLINLDLNFKKSTNDNKTTFFIEENYNFSITVSQGDNATEVFYFDASIDKDFLGNNDSVKSATEIINDFI
jgi:hypothetical protein